MNNPIGIIDSGIGGLSIASVLIKGLPKESFIYLADSKNCPYGVKNKDEIYRLTKKMVEFLVKKKIKLLVVACNTITVTSIDKLRKEFKEIPIVGIVPVIKTAREKTQNGKIGVFSTVATANSSYQKDLINKFTKGSTVINYGSSNLVSLIEKGNEKQINKLLKEELKICKEKFIEDKYQGRGS
ncbi:glutamate racemase, partial [Patescibacteria group bacterium]|nr:glutamate racemase [Patescibacteria group bacterium]